MNVKIQAVGFSIDQVLKDTIESKIKKLSTFNDKIIDVSINLKLDSHTKIKDKVILIKCNIPHATFISESSSKSFEESLDISLEDIIRQIKKKKEQDNSRGQALDNIEYKIDTEDFSQID